MARDFPFHRDDRVSSSRPGDHFIVNPSLLDPRSYHNPAYVAANATLEAALAALRGTNVETPVDFALMVSLGPHLCWFTSDGLRHVESRLFSEHFKDDFLDGLSQSSHSIPCDPYNTEDRRPSYSSDTLSSHRNRGRFLERRRDGHISNKLPSRRRRPRAGSEIAKTHTPMPAQISNSKVFVISDRHEVAQYYAQRFKDLQQTACKVIAKAFIKVIEPRKQTTHPYTRGAESAPSWWPPCPPPGYKGVHPTLIRHKEPDHLYKDERIRLCVHILHAVNSRNPHRSTNIKALTIRDLERVSNDAMVQDFFSDRDGGLAASNPDKRPWLRQCFQELFYVANQEERFMDGALDADTTVKVMHGKGHPNTDEGEDDDLKGAEKEGGEAQGIRTPESFASLEVDQMRSPTQLAQQSDYSLPLHIGIKYSSIEEPRCQENGMQSTNMQQQQQFMPIVYQSSGIQERERRSEWFPNFTSTPNSYCNWTNPQTNMVTTPCKGLAGFSPTNSPPKQPCFNLPSLSPPSHCSAQVYSQPQYRNRLSTGSLGLCQLSYHDLKDNLHDDLLDQGEH